MIIHNVIIVTTSAGAACHDGTIDRVIRRVLDLAKTPILVVGPEGDDVLRSTRLIEDCELVFDPNFEGNLFSSIKAGLHAATGPSFLILLQATDRPWDNPSSWRALENTLDPEKIKACDLVLPLAENGIDSRDDLPVVITAKGVQSLVRLPAQTDWISDANIRIAKVPVPPPLAS